MSRGRRTRGPARRAAVWGAAAWCAVCAAGPAAAQGGTIAGRVVDHASGRPLSGVIVTYRPRGGRQPLRYWNGRPSSPYRSDAAGRVTLPGRLLGQEAIAIDPIRGCSDWIPLTRATRSVVFRIRRANTITGTVRRGPAGPVVPNAQVRFKLVIDHREYEGPGTTADAAGRYRITAVPPGLALRPGLATTPRLAGAREDPAGPVRFDGFGRTITRDVIAVPRPGVEVTYRLRLADGPATLPKVSVLHEIDAEEPATSGAWQGTRSATVNGVQTTTLQRRAGAMIERHTRRAWTAAPDPGRPELTLFLPAGRNRVSLVFERWAVALPERVVAAAAPPEHTTVVLRPRARLILQMTDTGGRPAARDDVQVHVSLNVRRGRSSVGFSLGAGTTDADGRYELTELLPVLRDADAAHYTLHVSCSGAQVTFPSGGRIAWSGDDLRRMAEAAGPHGVFLRAVQAVPPVPVQFRFLDQAAQPVAGVRVRLPALNLPAVVTDGEGRATLQLPPGRHSPLLVDLRDGTNASTFERVHVPLVTVPSPDPVTVQVVRQIAFFVPLEIEGDTPEQPITPGRVSIQAFDATGAVVDGAQVLHNRRGNQKRLWVRVPFQARRIVLSLRNQSLEIATPNGAPADPPVWKLK